MLIMKYINMFFSFFCLLKWQRRRVQNIFGVYLGSAEWQEFMSVKELTEHVVGFGV